MLRDADTRLQASEGPEARPSWRYADACGGHRNKASLRLGRHRVRRGATSNDADGGRNGPKANPMQVAERSSEGFIQSDLQRCGSRHMTSAAPLLLPGPL